MPPATDTQDMHHQTFDFLLFRLGSFLLGVAAEQVIQIRRGVISPMNPGGQQVNLKDIFQISPDTQKTDSAAVLAVESQWGRTYVPVDSAEGTIALELGQIKQLPPLIDDHKCHPALWGLALLKNGIVFLVDLDRIRPDGSRHRKIKSNINPKR